MFKVDSVYMGVDGNNSAAWNLTTLVPVDQCIYRCYLNVYCFLDHLVWGDSGVVQHRGFFPLDGAMIVPGMLGYG